MEVSSRSEFEPQEIKKEQIKNHRNMKKQTAIFLGIVIVVVVALAVWAGIAIAGMSSGAGSANPSAPSPYSAVYLTTGDIYFGKLSWFPSPHMSDAWYITRNQNQSGQTQLGLAPMKNIFRGPIGNVDFNAQTIVFSTRLLNGSQVVQAIENPSTLSGSQGNATGAAQQQQQQQGQQVPSPSSTPSGK